MLPNIFGKAPSVSPGGQNPNQRTQNPKNGPSVLSQYSSSLASQLSDNISPSNFIRQGTYGAYGNNALTRGAMGAMDATSDLFDKLLGIGGEDENLTTTDKLLKEQIKLLNEQDGHIKETNDILKEILEVEKAKLTPEKSEKIPDETDVEKIEKKKKKPKLTPNDFAEKMVKGKGLGEIENTGENELIVTIAKDVVDIKDILTHGFESLEEAFRGESNFNGKKRPRRVYDVEDAKIMNETKFSKTDADKKFLKKFQIESLKYLKRIASGVDRIYDIITKSTDLTAPENAMEAARKEKHMGMAQEVTDVIPKKETPLLTDETGGGIGGAVTGLIATLVASLTAWKSKIIDLFKAGAEKFTSMAKSAWEAGKGVIEKTFSFVKEKGASMLESAEKAASGMLEKIAGKGGVKGLAKTGLKNIIKAIPGVGELAMGGLAAYDAYKASNQAEDILDIKDRKATTGEKVEAGIGGAVESLTFGLLDKKKTAKWIDGLMSTKEDKRDELTKKQDELNEATRNKVNPPAEAAGAPSVSVNNTNNSYFAGKRNARNEDTSYNRYLDRHYAF